MDSKVALTRHAIDRYRLKYPTANDDDLYQAISDGIDVDPITAHSITGRNASGYRLRKKGTRYIMHKDRTGMFTINTQDQVVTTFLRFEGFQREKILELWPLESVAVVKATQEPVVEAPVAETLVTEEAPASPAGAPPASSVTVGSAMSVSWSDSVVKESPVTEISTRKATWENMDNLSLPHLAIPATHLRVAASLVTHFSSVFARPVNAARRAAFKGMDTITPIHQDLCSIEIEVGPAPPVTMFLVRRRNFERGAPAWWLCPEIPEPLPEIQIKMAQMLVKRGWVCTPPSP